MANRDIITDFDTADLISFKSIDTNPILAGDQAFTFVGSGLITGNWQVGYQIIGADTLVLINTTGTVMPEMEILLVGYNIGLTTSESKLRVYIWPFPPHQAFKVWIKSIPGWRELIRATC